MRNLTIILLIFSSLSYANDLDECIDFVCDNLPEHECNQEREVIQVLKACKGNYGSGCIETVTTYLRSMEYNSRREMIEIAKACRYNDGGGCVDSVCSRTSHHRCNSRRELIKIAKKCGSGYPFGYNY